MALEPNHHSDASLRPLVEGFITLSKEYKHLAERHRILEANLSSATDQLASLKEQFADRIPEEQKQKEFCNGPAESTPRKSLSEWLEVIRGPEGSDAQETITRIKDAELACFGMQNRFDENAASEAGRSRRTPSVRGGPPNSKYNRVRIGGTSDIEQDFTTPGIAGKLHCPFAPKSGNNNLAPKAMASQRLGRLTPRSGGSLAGSGGARSKRGSFNDPIKPAISISAEVLSTVESEAASNGPACPIRFLGDHPPEEVAKYFEEHKHEIPRSHEVCVRRFQSDSETMNKLDAKYGNMVSMIQGLGQKHQPMLPETPDPEKPTPEEERKSNNNVKKWANAVSEAPYEDDGAPEPKTNGTRSEGGRGEERVSHFDRPLKEIRVGESPSRPWGVPIPSKYLDRAASPDNISLRAASPPAPVKVDLPADAAKPELQPAGGAEKAELPERPKGKCPFDHKALARAAQPKSEAPKPGVKAQDFAPEETQMAEEGDTPKVTESTTLHGAQSDGAQLGHIINTGMVVVADQKYLGTRTVENQGVLIIGYGGDEARKMLMNPVQYK